MKRLLIISIVFISCQQGTKTFDESLIDTTGKAAIKDSILNTSMVSALTSDSANADKAPVIVLYARPVIQEYSSYKNIRVAYKNVSGKDISGIKFKWYGLNAFNDPAQSGGAYAGIGTGFTDDLLRSGKTNVATFEILSKDLKKVVKAWVYEVAFEDGTKWQAK